MDHQIGSTAIESIDPLGKVERFLHSPNLFMLVRWQDTGESKELSQGDIEKRTGLFRCYISRVENGHTVPAIETLEKMARALVVPMYRLFHAGEVPAGLSKLKPPMDDEFGRRGAEADYFSKLRRLLAKMEPDDQKLLLHMAQKVARD